MRTWTLALLFLVPAATAVAQDSERIPNNDTAQAYPWWTEPADPRPGSTDSSDPAIAVSRGNVVTIAWSQDSMVYVSDNKYESRNANGWSNAVAIPNQMVGAYGLYVFNGRPDIAYDSNHTLHIVWEGVRIVQNDPPDQLHRLCDMRYARRLNDGTWEGPFDLMLGSYTPPGASYLVIQYTWPRIAVDRNNQAHFTTLERRIIGVSGSQGEDRKIMYQGPTGTETIVMGAVSIDSDHPFYGPAPISCADESGTVVPHVSFVYSKAPTLGTRGYYAHAAARYGGGWSSLTRLGDPGVYSNFTSIYAAQPDAAAHVVYDKFSGGTGLDYRRRPSGSGSAYAVADNVNSSNTTIAAVVADYRNQPHVLFKASSLSYACKISGTWKYQNPIQHIVNKFETTMDLAINRNDGIYMTTGVPALFDAVDHPGQAYQPDYQIPKSGGGKIWYVRSYEPNLGSQDGPVNVPIGPGAAVNTATGGLIHSLPLFAAKGVGFPASLTLTYNSLEWDRGVFTQGWTHSYHMYLVDHKTGFNVADDRITVVFGDGRSVVFKWDSGASRLLALDEYGYFGNLVRNGSLWDGTTAPFVLTNPLGTQFSFDNYGKLTRILDTNSNDVVLTYNGQPDKRVLIEIKDSTSRTTTIEYGSGTKENKIQKLIDPAGASYTFAYDNGDPNVFRLNTVTFSGGVVWDYDHHTVDDAAANQRKRINLLSQIKTPRGNATKLKYFKDNRAAASTDPQLSQPSITDGGGTLTQHPDRTLTYTDPASPTASTRPSIQFQNRRGTSMTLEIEYRRSIARKTTDYAAGVINRTFDGTYRNLKSVQDQSNNTTSYSYTHEEGTQESPTWVKGMLRAIKPPGANSSMGGGSGAASMTYTYSGPTINSAFRVATVTDALSNITTYEYDTPNKGNLVRIKYPSTGGTAAEEQFANDAKGRITRQASPSGAVTIISYGDASSGLMTQLFRPSHNAADQFAYDVMGNVTSSSTPLGGTTSTVYDTLYRAQSITPPAGDEATVITYSYDTDSNVVSVSGPGQAQASFSYDEMGRKTSESRATSSGVSSGRTLHYDPEGNLRKAVDPRGKSFTATYDQMGRQLTDVRPGSATTAMSFTYTYFANGMRQSETNFDQTTAYTYTYTGQNLLKDMTSPVSGIVDARTYTADGLTESQTRMVSGLPATGTKNLHNARRQLIAVTQISDFVTGAGLTTTFTLDADGNRIAVTDPSGRRTLTDRDAAGRAVRTKDHGGRTVSEVSYNDDDLPETFKSLDPETNTLLPSQSRSYNSRGQLKSSTDAEGNVTVFAYDARGNVKFRRSPPSVGAGGAIQSCYEVYEYNLANQLTRVTHDPGSPTQASTSYSYDENGNRTAVTDPRGFTYQMRYDDANRLIERTYPSPDGTAYVESWSYNDRGNLTTYVDLQGKTTTYEYDAMGRQTRETHVRAGITLSDLQKAYDGASNLISILDQISKVKVSFTTDLDQPAYDVFRRLKQVRWFLEANTPQQIMWKKVSYSNADGTAAYDTSGNLTRMVDPEGNNFDYLYNEYNQLTQINRTPLAGSIAALASFTYFASGEKRDVVLQGGTRHSYHYDRNSRLKTQETLRSDGKVLARYDHSYDSRDRRIRTQMHHLMNQIDYTYDCQDRLVGEVWSGNAAPPGSLCQNQLASFPPGNKNSLVGVTATSGSAGTVTSVPTFSWSCQYDPNGNRVSQVKGPTTTLYTYDSQNRLTQETVSGSATVTYGYDRNGNMTSRTAGATPERLSYDYSNKLSSYERGPVGSPSTSIVTRYAPTGERLAKVNILQSQANEEWFMYDNNNPTADYVRTTGSASFALQRTYAYSRTLDAALVRFDAGALETPHFYVGDSQGTAQQMIDASGTTERHVLQTAWGERLPGFSQDVTPAERRGFTQREHDQETDDANGNGLISFRARSYDPRIGRFVQTDPIPGNRTTEHYLYAGNNPVSRVDPTGEEWVLPKNTPGAEVLLRDLSRYTGLYLTWDPDGSVKFLDDSDSGKSYASDKDMQWIRSVQNDSSKTHIAGLSRHLSSGDKWHQERFRSMFLDYAWGGEYSPVTEAAKQGNSWGIYQAPAEYQEDPAFMVGVWSWRVAQAALAGAGALKALGINVVLWGGGTAGTVAAGPASQRLQTVVPELGRKFEYLFGNATGNQHNIDRSRDLLAKLHRIGISDVPRMRAYLQTFFEKVLNDPTNVATQQANGRVVRESLLMGPLGGLKVQSIWEGAKLITVYLFGGGG